MPLYRLNFPEPSYEEPAPKDLSADANVLCLD